MLLSKEFLHTALDYARYFINDKEVKREHIPDKFFTHEISFSIDSRTLEKDQIFVALKGERCDGHNFIEQACELGALGLIVQQDAHVSRTLAQTKNLNDRLIIRVPNTFQALIDLAKHWRAQLDIPVIGITGSVGKTSTKEIMRSILHAAKIDAYVSHANQNTILGLSLNILNVSPKHKVAVFEMGINEPGEMAELADVARPTIGLITCITHAHGQGLGTLAQISHEKRQLFEHFTPTDIGIICGDQKELTNIYYPHPVTKFGLKIKNQVHARKIEIIKDSTQKFGTRFILNWYNQKSPVMLNSTHDGTIFNALAASTIAYFLDIPLATVITGLEAYAGYKDRFEQKKLKNNMGTLISDCYNANPASMKAALKAFDLIPTDGKKIAVLGDMLELGEKEAYWHRQIGRFLHNTPSIDVVICVGPLSQHIADMLPSDMLTIEAKNWQAAQIHLDNHIKTPKHSANNLKDPLVLIKASNGMMLDKLVRAFAQ